MKRACMVRNSYYPPMPPVKRNAETLVSHGYEVDVICLKRNGQKKREIIHGVRVYRLPIEHHRAGFLRYIFEYSAFFFLSFWELAWLSIRRRYQIVEVSGIPDFLVFIAIIPRLLGAAVILNFLDHTADYFAEKFMLSPEHAINKLLRLLERTSARWPDHVFTTQSVTMNLLESRGVPKSKMSVVPNVPNEGIFHHRSATHNASYNDNGNFCLITHGSLLEIYGIQTLIKAVPLLIEKIPHLKVKVVGDGEYRPHLEQLAQSLGITKYIEFTGPVPQIEIPAHINQAHIGIVAVKCKFPALSNKIFEYLASGTPAVVTSISTHKAYFDDNSVMFYEPENENDLARCILELYRNPEKRAALAVSGSAVYQKYRWSVMKYEYLKVFEQLSARKQSAG